MLFESWFIPVRLFSNKDEWRSKYLLVGNHSRAWTNRCNFSLFVVNVTKVVWKTAFVTVYSLQRWKRVVSTWACLQIVMVTKAIQHYYLGRQCFDSLISSLCTTWHASIRQTLWTMIAGLHPSIAKGWFNLISMRSVEYPVVIVTHDALLTWTWYNLPRWGRACLDTHYNYAFPVWRFTAYWGDTIAINYNLIKLTVFAVASKALLLIHEQYSGLQQVVIDQ